MTVAGDRRVWTSRRPIADPVPPALRASWDSSPALVTVTTGADHLLAYQNVASVRVFGLRQTGVPLPVAFPELGERPLEEMSSVRETGRVVDVRRADAPVRDVHGDPVQLSYVLAPLGTAAPYDGVVITSVDVTAETQATRSVARAELLSRLSGRMNAAADPDAALRALTDELVPNVADLAAVFVVPKGHDGAPAQPPSAMTVSHELLAAVGPPPLTARGEREPAWQAALAAGRTLVIDLVESPVAATDESAAWMSKAAAHTLVVVPLAVAGDLTGALVLLATDLRARYTDRDVGFLEDVAARAGTAVANTRAHQQQRQVALNLQRALLPAAPPPLRGLAVTARYVAGSDDVEIGGDWWDVHDLGAGRVGIGVGDVSGRGVPAAIVMGQARSGMRAAAHAGLAPGDLLTVLDAQVTDLVPVERTDASALQPRFATATYAVIDTYAETARIANAGHTPLLVRDPVGVVRRVSAPPGPPLGLGFGGYEEMVIAFPAGSLLLGFTDGLVESSTVDIDSGIDRLAAHLAGFALDADLDEVADALLPHATGADDAALVLLGSDPSMVPVARYTATLDHLSDVPRIRHELTRRVAQHTVGLTGAVEQVAAELLANAMSHVGPPVVLRADMAVDRVVVEVADRSASAPRARVPAADDEHGRGLPIVGALVRAWGSRITRTGKATWAELGPTPGPRPDG